MVAVSDDPDAWHPEDALILDGAILVNTITLGLQFRPAVTAMPDGGFAIAWEDYSSGSGTGRDTTRIGYDAVYALGGTLTKTAK